MVLRPKIKTEQSVYGDIVTYEIYHIRHTAYSEERGGVT